MIVIFRRKYRCILAGLWPEGPGNQSPGFTLGFGLLPEALKGRPLTRHPEVTFRNAGAPFRASSRLERVTQGKPWAMFSWPFGPSPFVAIRHSKSALT
jgi:hypothetical protein